MDLIKKIKKTKNLRNLIIYDKEETFNLFKKNFKLDNWLHTYNPVYTIYYAKSYNPPFFNNIISIRNNNNEDVEQIWNMTCFDGYFIINSSFKNKFSNSFVKEDPKLNLILVKKNNLKLLTLLLQEQ